MRTSSRSKLVVGLSFLGLGSLQAAPVKTVDHADGGNNCDPATEQYLQIEGLDQHDHPKFTMRWRQVTGPCGAVVPDSELVSWEVSYDGSTDDSPDSPPQDPPDSGNRGRVQLNLFVCCPFGEYELDLDVESVSGGTIRQQRTSWEIENGPDEFHIWDTFNTEHGLNDDEVYAPTTQGKYTWPLQGETGFYKTIIAGPLPPLQCESSVPAGTEYVECFEAGVFNSASKVLGEIGPDGMTAQICANHCADYDFFGLESGSECYCGTAGDFASAVPSTQCGLTYPTLCTGDATTACGGVDAVSVYVVSGVVAPAPPTPTPPTPTPPVTPETTYSRKGCFADPKSNRIMGNKMVNDTMSAEICHVLCDDGTNTHFGTQYATECWCAVDPDLLKNGEKLELDECDMACVGTTSGEFCGGRDKITAYEIEPELPGCYADNKDTRAMDLEGKYVSDEMTTELCIKHCTDKGHAFAGTQYSTECWCGDDNFGVYGKISADVCSYPCAGDAEQMCGGYDALSVYSTAA